MLKATILFLFAIGTLAKPITTQSSYENMGVYIRGTNMTFTHHDGMASKIRENPTQYGLASVGEVGQQQQARSERSHAKVIGCQDSACQENCKQLFNATFASNFCIKAELVECLIISDLSAAKVRYWESVDCNENQSTYNGCADSAPIIVPAPGTNSIGIQAGC